VPVKVSVLLPEELHRKIKMASVQRGTSIQDVMEAAAQRIIDPQEEHRRFSPKEIRVWQGKLKKVLEHGDRLAQLNCTASIDAMYRQVERRQNVPITSDDDQILQINRTGRQTVHKAG
jgi:hypothetical protein